MRCRPWLLRVLVALPLAGLTVYCAAVVWQTWLGPRVRNVIDRQRARAEEGRRWDRHRADDGVVGDLANGRVRAGDSLEALTDRRPPSAVRRYVQFTEVFYDFPDDTFVVLNARDGRLVDAQWIRESGRRQPPRPFEYDRFFEMSSTDRMDWQVELSVAVAARRDARMAAAGPPAYIAFHDPLSLTRGP